MPLGGRSQSVFYATHTAQEQRYTRVSTRKLIMVFEKSENSNILVKIVTLKHRI